MTMRAPKPAAARPIDTIGAAFDRAGGRSSGFDYLRLGLAVAVLAWHSFRISDALTDYDGWWGPFVRLILPMFFALSGFLVAGSLERVTAIHHFIILRIMRIMPALFIQLLFSAIIIGGLFTVLPPADYFTHPMFLDYFWNSIGRVRYFLPGVFTDNPVPVFNVSLWTIPFEIKAYLLLISLWLMGAVRRPWLLMLSLLVMQCVSPLIETLQGAPLPPVSHVSGDVLVFAFCFGTALYLCRDTIPLRTSWALAALAIALLLLASPAGGDLAGPPAAYFTVWLGLRNPQRIGVLASADISYGIYLYAYPIQQSVVALFPDLRVWWFIIPVSLLLTLGMAILSWRHVEKPALGHRRRLIAASDRLRARLKPATAAPPVRSFPPPA
jgi:peptidoglycan/LPS O-acetylase OafA/YrhL